ncbi:MAG: glycoside hydrolase family 97 protein [Muribaculaceae bacterium]|nr:glycoside hydrolase family 97 protein [Muribaculaceae bacterium]
MKKPIILFSMALVAAGAMAETVTSPNGKLVIDVTCEGGKPAYTADYWGVNFLQSSPLGLKTNLGDYTQGLELLKVSDSKPISGEYSLPNIKNSHVEWTANTRTFTFGKDGKPVMDVVFNVKDCDVAFKYVLLPHGETLSARVEDEATGFAFPEGTTTFLCPQMMPMTGFARTAPSYETSYTIDAPMGTNGWGDGFVFPCLFKNGDEGWMLVSETGVDGTYCASHLDNVEGNLYAIDFPNPAELNGNGHNGAGVTVPGETPWRTITFGHSLRPITATTVPWDFVEQKYPASKEYDYGKGTWSWIMKMDPSCNFDEQKRYIDFAAAMGWETVLVDALWDTQIGYDRVEELAKYGKEKGVDLYLWYNSNGYWNDAPQGPRHKMATSAARRAEMAWMQKNGIRGIKVDFFGGDKQQMMQLYEDILTDANDYGILVIFHGCTLPRGWERMYPNFAAAEAVRASENLHFSQGECDNEAFAATIHPLVRNTVGSMDFGGSALNKYWNADNTPGRGNKRMTSDVFALATAVLFQSPVQHFALAPNNLEDAPAWAIDFMKAVPTTWDEVRFIDGYPGKYLILARRSGDKWYIAGINAQAEPVKAKVKLDMLDAGQQVTAYVDDKDLNGSVKTIKVNKKQEVDVFIPTNGAVLIVE